MSGEEDKGNRSAAIAAAVILLGTGLAFFVMLAQDYGADPERIVAAVDAYQRDPGPRAVQALRRAYRFLKQSGLNIGQAVERIEAELSQWEECRVMAAFIRSSRRGIIK